MNLNEKFALTPREASVYFNIGLKKMRRLAQENTDSFSVSYGNRYLIIRTKFEEYLTKEASKIKGGNLMKAGNIPLGEKEYLSPKEAIKYWNLSQRKFYAFLKKDHYNFIAYYGDRKLILRNQFEAYLNTHPEVKDALANRGKSIKDNTTK